MSLFCSRFLRPMSILKFVKLNFFTVTFGIQHFLFRTNHLKYIYFVKKKNKINYPKKIQISVYFL